MPSIQIQEGQLPRKSQMEMDEERNAQASAQGADALKDFFKGISAQQTQKRNLGLAQNVISQQAKAGRSVSTKFGPDGEVDIKQAEVDPLSALLKQKQLQNMDEERLAKRTERTTGALHSAGIDEYQAQKANLRAASGGDKLISVGGAKNAVPDWAVPAAEAVSTNGLGGKLMDLIGVKFPKGSGQERQALAALDNTVMHAKFGSQQTHGEAARFAKQTGRSLGGTAENAEAGYEGLDKLMQGEGRNIMAGVGGPQGQVAKRIKESGGSADFAPPPAAAPKTAAKPAAKAFDPDAYLKGN